MQNKKTQTISFRMKLTLSYVILIILPVLFVSLGYYNQGSATILDGLRVNYLSVLRQSNDLANNRFKELESRVRDLHMDRQLYDYFSNYDLNDLQEAEKNDEMITEILNRYFPITDDIYTVYLITSSYTYGMSPNFWLPKNKFSQSEVYNIGKIARNKLTWIPPYDLLDALKMREDEKIELKKFDEIIFTATRNIELASIENNMLKPLKKTQERPVIAIHFKENMFQKIFDENITNEGSYYYIFTQQGQVVSKSRNAAALPLENLIWLKSAYEVNSGTSLALINGTKMLICYDVMDTTGWMSVYFIPYTNVVKPLTRTLFVTVFFAVFIVVLAIIISAIFSKRISGPIKLMLEAIRKMKVGNFDIQKQEVKGSEFQFLFENFYDMTERLERLIRENYQVRINEQEAEIKALYFQFNPHFLYNTLNVINWMAIDNEQDEISEMLVQLSDILEYTSKSDRTIVTFEEEMNYINNYIFLMKHRFIDRFEVIFDIEKNLYRLQVPKFFMQPFLENAILHGFEEMESGGVITVTGWTDENGCWFSISDNGKGMEEKLIQRIMNAGDTEEEKRRKSIGIQIIHQRIQKLFGQEFGIAILSEVGEGTTVTIRLPRTDESEVILDER